MWKVNHRKIENQFGLKINYYAKYHHSMAVWHRSRWMDLDQVTRFRKVNYKKPLKLPIQQLFYMSFSINLFVQGDPTKVHFLKSSPFLWIECKTVRNRLVLFANSGQFVPILFWLQYFLWLSENLFFEQKPGNYTTDRPRLCDDQ